MLAIVAAIPATVAAVASWHAALGTSRGNTTLGVVKEAVNGGMATVRAELELMKAENLALKVEIVRLQSQLPPRRAQRRER